jgi:glycosyltransferase involved in cell wall biosynthesis
LIITGGKIDSAKRIDVLMEAVIKLNKDNVKLLVFGQPSDAMLSKIEMLSKDNHICYIGWISSDKVYDYFLASDLCVFPGTHSVLWEQACACGIPGIFKDWEGMHHVDVGGNVLFLKESSVEEIQKTLLVIIDNNKQYEKMKTIAMESRVMFSYRRIAERAITG